jgi:hypothetical protein
MSTTTRGLSLGIAIILLIAALFFWQLPNGAIDATQRLGFVGIPILLAIAFGGGTVYDVIRGRQSLLEADANGIWIKGMPRLSWSEVADIRTEEIVGFNGLRTSSGSALEVGGFEIELGQGGVRPLEKALADHEVFARNRLGIVPMDQSLIPASGAFGGLSGYVEDKNQEAAARIGRKPIERAPFGLWETEMDAFFEDVVAGIRRFHDVGALSDLAGVTRPPGM